MIPVNNLTLNNVFLDFSHYLWYTNQKGGMKMFSINSLKDIAFASTDVRCNGCNLRCGCKVNCPCDRVCAAS